MADLLGRLTAALAGRYRVQREIGRGGMALVFLAHDLKLDRPVALKVLRPELAAALGEDRFLREIALAAKLEHPHILPVHDSGSTGDLLYYVMPYVEGESLRERLTREQQLPLDDALQIAREVADALSYAHAHGIIHRDVKPENILFEAGHAVVADFGVARAVDQVGGDALTTTGVALGTPVYMSPEQAAGSRNLDGRADLYALGCVLHEMLAGQPPFTGPSAESLVRQHLSATPPAITGIRPAVPSHVAVALERALAKAPADRFRSVALFSEAIRAPSATALVPPGARASAAGGQGWSWERKALIGLLAAVGLAALALAGQWVLAPGPPVVAAVPRIVVLPFVNLGAEEDAYLAAGITDVVTARLAVLPGIQVISGASARQVAADVIGAGDIRRRLAATHVLEGTVQRERPGDPASPVRVIPQLVDLEQDAHLWAATFDQVDEGIFAIQSAIADSVASALALAFTPTESKSPRGPTTSQEAYDLYLRGLYFRGQATAVGFDSARHYLERAVGQDSTFAAAFAALGQLYSEIGGVYAGTESWDRRAEAAARRAIALDSSLADGWSGLSRARYSRSYGFDHEEAVRYVRKALILNPNASDAHEHLAFVLTHVGMLDEADREVQITRTLDPLNRWAQFRLGQIALARGEYEVAATELTRLPTLWARPYLAEALIGQRRPRDALEVLAGVDTLDPARASLTYSVAAMAHAQLGERARALELIRIAGEGVGLLVHAHHLEYNIGATHAMLGEHKSALEWFQRAVDGGFPCLPSYERAEFIGELTSDARYAEFLGSLRRESTRLRRSIEAMLDTP